MAKTMFPLPDVEAMTLSPAGTCLPDAIVTDPSGLTQRFRAVTVKCIATVRHDTRLELGGIV
jgi:hypothetical protein